MKIDISSAAVEKLEAYFGEKSKDKQKDLVRVYISRYG
ncbi:hypothetical protein CLIT_23c01050 [Peptoclostridium litorale DSM 5388]|uniref:Uncharacterized protein n=2 Tax=Peptoclostridium litorale TaxID=1557 RepID=A0A069RAJ1_PEPLI|nr:hypothetical protein CLIT_23c01050 [Peptoclostridium litorale DSM 5388]